MNCVLLLLGSGHGLSIEKSERRGGRRRRGKRWQRAERRRRERAAQRLQQWVRKLLTEDKMEIKIKKLLIEDKIKIKNTACSAKMKQRESEPGEA